MFLDWKGGKVSFAEFSQLRSGGRARGLGKRFGSTRCLALLECHKALSLLLNSNSGLAGVFNSPSLQVNSSLRLDSSLLTVLQL